MTRYLMIVGLLLVAACTGPRPMGGPVAPSAPGPVDLVRGLWGDYGGRCPSDYHYCKGDRDSVCCPMTSRCEDDADGAYCGAPRSATAGVGRRPREAREYACSSDQIACSFGGRTTCCQSDLHCCVSDGAPACCESPRPDEYR